MQKISMKEKEGLNYSSKNKKSFYRISEGGLMLYGFYWDPPKAMVSWFREWRIDRCNGKSSDRKKSRDPFFFILASQLYLKLFRNKKKITITGIFF